MNGYGPFADSLAAQATRGYNLEKDLIPPRSRGKQFLMDFMFSLGQGYSAAAQAPEGSEGPAALGAALLGPVMLRQHEITQASNFRRAIREEARAERDLAVSEHYLARAAAIPGETQAKIDKAMAQISEMEPTEYTMADGTKVFVSRKAVGPLAARDQRERSRMKELEQVEVTVGDWTVTVPTKDVSSTFTKLTEIANKAKTEGGKEAARKELENLKSQNRIKEIKARGDIQKDVAQMRIDASKENLETRLAAQAQQVRERLLGKLQEVATEYGMPVPTELPKVMGQLPKGDGKDIYDPKNRSIAGQFLDAAWSAAGPLVPDGATSEEMDEIVEMLFLKLVYEHGWIAGPTQ